jgi:hypothetical protein
LNHRDRSLLGFRDDRERLIVHLVIFFIGCRRRFDFSLGLEHFRSIGWPALLLDEFHHPKDLLV